MSKELSKDVIKKLAAKGRESFYFFTKAVLGYDKLDKSVHKDLCDQLQNHRENTRLAIILPRGWYKSTICTIAYPLWRAVCNPEVRILLVQNTYSNATGKLGAIKQIVKGNKMFQMLYPELLPTNDSKWSRDGASLNREGAYPEATWEAAGTGTQKTGQHYDVIIEDDTVSPEKDNLTGAMMQPTQAEIEKAIGWFKLATPLLIEPLESQRIVVGTRWSDNDLLGYVLNNHPEYKIISRAVRETDGKPDPQGELAWPVRFDDDVLKSVEVDLGPYMFAALYLNCPTAAANQVFKREWINYYQEEPANLVMCTSVDLASASLEESSDPDYNVIMTAGVNPTNGHIYIMSYTRDRMSPSAVIDTIFQHYRAFKPVKVMIEGIGYQRTIKHWLEQKQRKLNEFFDIEILKSHSGSKEDRIRGLQPYFSANKIFIRQGMGELERELLSFPKASHDDVIDTLSMQLPFFNESTTLVAQDKADRLARDPHAFAVILDEIKERKTKHLKYPYDMGIMSHNLGPLNGRFNGTGVSVYGQKNYQISSIR